jgi:hypothetical protein
VELEFPLAVVHKDLALFDVIPVNFFVGAEITNLYFGRFQLAPTMLIGLSWAYFGEDARTVFGIKDTFLLTHISGKAFFSLSCLVSRRLKITADAGMIVLIDSADKLTDPGLDSYFKRKAGPFVSLGLTFK